MALLFVVLRALLIGVYAAIGEPFGEVSTDPLTPIGLAVVSLSLAAAVPVVILTTRLAQDLPGGWILSVVGRLRWRWLLTCIGLAAVAIGAAVRAGARAARARRRDRRGLDQRRRPTARSRSR